MPDACGLVLARDAECRVQILAALEASRAIRIVQVRRIDVVFRAFAHRLRALLRADRTQEFRERRAGEDVDAPRLQVAAGRRALRSFENLDYGVLRHWRVEERAATDAAVDGFGDEHGASCGDG